MELHPCCVLALSRRCPLGFGTNPGPTPAVTHVVARFRQGNRVPPDSRLIVVAVIDHLLDYIRIWGYRDQKYIRRTSPGVPAIRMEIQFEFSRHQRDTSRPSCAVVGMSVIAGKQSYRPMVICEGAYDDHPGRIGRVLRVSPGAVDHDLNFCILPGCRAFTQHGYED